MEMMIAIGAVLVSFGGAIFNFYKLTDDQKTWEHEQKISMEKALLFKKLNKRYSLYAKTFKLLGTVRDIEYPIEHHLDLENNKQQVIATADLLLDELYGEAGMFMEYKTRSQILKTYQNSYKYVKGEVSLSELIDSYYIARRYLREDLEFDDNKGTKKSQDILKNQKKEIMEEKQKNEKSIWAKKNILAHSSRPGYPNKNVSFQVMKDTVNEWKKLGIQSIICLLSNEEIEMYYKSINCDLISFYKKEGFEVFHISIPDYEKPPVNDENLKLIDSQYKHLKQPILIHCGAGQDRTGQTRDFLIDKYNII